MQSYSKLFFFLRSIACSTALVTLWKGKDFVICFTTVITIYHVFFPTTRASSPTTINNLSKKEVIVSLVESLVVE